MSTLDTLTFSTTPLDLSDTESVTGGLLPLILVLVAFDAGLWTYIATRD